MARLGPWDAGRRVAVAVSGGADSLCLALLAKRWGDPAAFIVDHGLRPESAAEAAAARAVLLAHAIPARVLPLHGLVPGPALAGRARDARYAALSAACRAAGLVDLLLGHHAGDQAETVLMRQRRGSGPAGLAGMAALAETDCVRLLRPLLATDPADLRAFVAAAGLVPAEDPGNADARTTRIRLRREIGTDRSALLGVAAQAGRDRTQAEHAVARALAEHASIYPEGYADLSPGPVAEAALAALLRSLSGRRYPVHAPGRLRAATAAGVRMQPAGDGWRLTREVQAMAPPVPAVPGAVWDGRFRVHGAPAGGEIGALGAEASRLRRGSALPATVLWTLPAFRYNGVLSGAPHLGYAPPAMVVEVAGVRSAGLPAAGAAFLAC